MLEYILSESFRLSISLVENKKIRISFYHKNEEWCCRKEKATIFLEFLNSKKEEQIFRGRLQFFKVNKRLFVEAKKVPILVPYKVKMIQDIEQLLKDI